MTEVPVAQDTVNKKVKKEGGRHLVLESREEVYSAVTKAVGVSKCLIIDGSRTSGKSSMVRQLLEGREYSTFYMDSQVDYKSLLGCYVVGDKIGEFRYQLNILLRSYVSGETVLLENFQESQQEVIQNIQALCQSPCLTLNGLTYRRKPSFKIIALASFKEPSEETRLRLCYYDYFYLPAYTPQEITQILRGKYRESAIVSVLLNSHVGETGQLAEALRYMERAVRLLNQEGLMNADYEKEAFMSESIRSQLAVEWYDCFHGAVRTGTPQSVE